MPAANACFDVSWDEDTRLARVDWAPGAVCGIEEAHAVDRALEKLGQGPVRCLVDVRGVDTIDRSAREHFIHSPHYAAVALVAESAATRMLANFFLRMNKGSTPARMFTVESEALEWLRCPS